MPSQGLIGGRYEVRDVVGRGGMGVVYRCFDRVVGREVAVKTLGDIQGKAALEMFYKEWRLLANLHHPNIVEIFDIGQFEDEGATKPYFVMPLLPGTTLETLLQSGRQTLSFERLVDIIAQTCRGLQAIHDNGLIHRDIKPSNIFVLDVNAVKLIDFGVAHLVGAATGTGVKGTASYMSPEQIRAEECTAASDVFSLGVVCYEALTGSKPFRGAKVEQVFDAILNQIPQPISELNPGVSPTLSRAVHKALAKQPRHRYGSASEFAETLQRAVRGEPVPALDPSRIQPRIQRAIRAFEQAKYDMAMDILSDLEAAGHVDPALTALRNQINHASRTKRVRELLDRALLGFEEDELTLALQNTEAALATSPDNEEALRLREKIQFEIGQREIQESLATAESAIEQYGFARARHLLQKILEVQPDNQQASALQQRLESREQAYRALRQQKEDLYRAAKEAWANSEFATAAERLRSVLALESQAPDTSTPDARANCSNFLNLAESAQSAIELLRLQASGCLEDGQYDRAIELCTGVTAKYSGHLLPHGLRFLAEASQKQDIVLRMAAAANAVASEPDLERKLDALRRAAADFPNQPIFEQWARAVREQLAIVNTAVAKARAHEKQGRFLEALEHWESVRAIYPAFPALDVETHRLMSLAGREPGDLTQQPVEQPRRQAFVAAATAEFSPPPLVENQVIPPVEPVQAEEPVPVLPAAEPKPVAPALSALRETVGSVREWLGSAWVSARRSLLPVRRLRWNYATVTAICVGLIIVAALVTSQRSERSRIAPAPPVDAKKARVVLKSAHAGALIRLNDIEGSSDGFDVEVAPGAYSLEVFADGYAPYKDVLNIPVEGLERALPPLQPLPSSVRLVTDIQKGSIRLDDRPAVPLTDSEFAIDDLAPGKHVLTVAGGQGEVQVEFTTADAGAPRIDGPIRTKSLIAFAAGSLGSRLQIGTSGAAPVLVDSRPPDETAGEASMFHGLARGPHEVLIAPGNDERRFAVETSHRPTLWVAVYSDRNVGSLIVSTGLEQFTVWVDGKEQKRRIRDGSMLIPNLPPKPYRIAVAADGYERSTEQAVEIKKGSSVRHTVSLEKSEVFAQLAMRGMPPQAQVIVDGAAVGSVDADGSFTLAKLEPGERTIELRHGPQFKSVPVKRSFAARESATLGSADFHVERAPALVTISASPQSARVEWACAGRPAQTGSSPAAASCAEGQVSVKVSAAGYIEESRTLAVAAGGKYPVRFELKRAEAAPVKVSCGAGDLMKAGWSQQEGWYSSGRGASLPCANIPGVYQFTMSAPTGFAIFGKSTGWTVSGSARTEFVLEKKAFGIKGQSKKNVEPYIGDGHITFQLALEPDKVTVAVRSGNSWETLATTTGNFGKAKVEFPKEVRLSNFGFYER